jgi:dihydroorotate dehydrogenase
MMAVTYPTYLSGVGKSASPGSSSASSSYDYYVTKTFTYEKCDGNQNPIITYDKDHDIMANNLGLPNPGISSYENAKQADIPTVLSVHPDCFWNDYDFTKLPDFVGVLEVNISCPNTTYGMVGYNLHILWELLKKIKPWQSKYFIGLKLPYYADRVFAQKIGLMCKHVGIHYVVCCNSFSGYVVGPSSSVICGMTSPHFRQLVLANCAWFVELDMHVIGCGGIRSEEDIKLYRNVGCIGVQTSRGTIKNAKLYFFYSLFVIRVIGFQS